MSTLLPNPEAELSMGEFFSTVLLFSSTWHRMLAEDHGASVSETQLLESLGKLVRWLSLRLGQFESLPSRETLQFECKPKHISLRVQTRRPDSKLSREVAQELKKFGLEFIVEQALKDEEVLLIYTSSAKNVIPFRKRT